MHRNLFRAALLLVALVVALGIAACNPRSDAPQVGLYRAVLRLPGGDAPFGLEIAEEQQQYVLYLINGAERTRVNNVRLKDGELSARFAGYENSLRAEVHRNSLVGSVARSRDRQRHDTDRRSSLSRGPGARRGLQLSTFAGGLAYLYKLKVGASGELEGDYWQGLASHEKVGARRNAAATLEGAGEQTTMRDASQRLDFTFPRSAFPRQGRAGHARRQGIADAERHLWLPDRHPHRP